VLASPAVARLAARGNRAAALTWAAIAEAGLGGVLLVWLISPSAAETAGYGSVLSVHRLARPIKLIMTLLIAVTAGGVIPLALAELFAADSGGYGFLLILAVIGMEVLAVQIPRATRPIPS